VPTPVRRALPWAWPLACAALLLAACATGDGERAAPRGSPEPVPPGIDPDSCLASAAARDYVQKVRDRVFAVWEPPAYTPYGEWAVTLLIRFDATGALAQVFPAEADHPLNDSAIAALERAAPFGPVPAEAICLSETPFGATFRIQVGFRRR
jgi:hypothetical protein